MLLFFKIDKWNKIRRGVLLYPFILQSDYNFGHDDYNRIDENTSWDKIRREKMAYRWTRLPLGSFSPLSH